MTSIDYYVFYHNEEKKEEALYGQSCPEIDFINLNELPLPKEFKIRGLDTIVNKAIFSEYLGLLSIEPQADFIFCATYSIPIKFSAKWRQESDTKIFLPAVRFEDITSLDIDPACIYSVEVGNITLIESEEMLDIINQFSMSEKIPRGPFKGTFIVPKAIFFELQNWLKEVTLYLLKTYPLESLKSQSSKFDESSIANRSNQQKEIDALRHKYGFLLERAVAYFLGAYSENNSIPIKLLGEEIIKQKGKMDLLTKIDRFAINNTIALSFGDSNYADVSEKWIQTVINSGVKNYIFIALDAELYESFIHKGYNVALHPFSGGLGDLWVFRLETIQIILEAGFNTLHSDADAFWVKNPMSLIDDLEFDIIASQGTIFPRDVLADWGHVICCGFLYFKASLKTLCFFQDLLPLSRKVKDDQIAVNRLLREMSTSWDRQNNSNYSLSIKDTIFDCYHNPLKGETKCGLKVKLIPHKQVQRLYEERREEAYVYHLLSEKNEQSKIEVFEQIENQLQSSPNKQINYDSNVIWLASFPRSGNTLMRTIFKHNFGLDNYSLYNDRLDIGKYESLREFVGHKDGEWECINEEYYQYPKYPEAMENLPSSHPTIIKTHSQFGPFYTHAKVIYVVRDPRAAISSAVSYRKQFTHPHKSRDELLEEFLKRGDLQSGHWDDHYTSWIENSKNILIIKFEDILEEFDQVLARISEFIEISPKRMTLTDFNQYKKVNPHFFRKGKKNSWQETFTKDQISKINKKSEKVMKKLGYS
ncbi:sulfotransferase domain-containing protein [Temperatibacter marinus]|uniref:Sulfotransferase domain-containing protein n=1 Tax=Temperatibacter marinus TaxID=1456591 RepID=A0AA52EIV3_9PROT|nr:sulfotransferase domain-containing protein [Temperatibacter marinus]WND03342.1 sulfotransferase domain-containing protein [Temperatibacter marinus]